MTTAPNARSHLPSSKVPLKMAFLSVTYVRVLFYLTTAKYRNMNSIGGTNPVSESANIQQQTAMACEFGDQFRGIPLTTKM